MNSGKSTALLQAAFNYEERGHRVAVIKPAIDTKAHDRVASRLGLTREVDYLLAEGDDALGVFRDFQDATATRGRISALLVDEAQFLTPGQVDGLLEIALIEGVPVLAYGIRTDFLTVAFPGSRRLLEIAHSLEELKTICRCGRKAIFNGRRIGDRFVFDGAQVAIDGSDVHYESLCGNCYLDEAGGRLPVRQRPV